MLWGVPTRSFFIHKFYYTLGNKHCLHCLITPTPSTNSNDKPTSTVSYIDAILRSPWQRASYIPRRPHFATPPSLHRPPYRHCRRCRFGQVVAHQGHVSRIGTHQRRRRYQSPQNPFHARGDCIGRDKGGFIVPFGHSFPYWFHADVGDCRVR